MSAADPEPRIAATALLGLWEIQAQSTGRHLDSTRIPARVQAPVTADVRRAARLLQAGLQTFARTPDGQQREQARSPARPRAGE